MGLEFIYINGQTPLDEEEKEDLKIKTISTRGELDEFEQANIEKAIEWTLKINPTYDKILSVAFIKEVHKRMFSEVWGWAGTFRKTNKNIGIDKYQIEIELTALMADCKFWIENKIFAEEGSENETLEKQDTDDVRHERNPVRRQHAAGTASRAGRRTNGKYNSNDGE